MWSRVWWGFWQVLQWCNDLHSFMKCPGLRHANTIWFQGANPLIMRQQLETWTCIEGMLLCFTDDAIRRKVGGVKLQIVIGCFLPEEEEHDDSYAWARMLMKSSSSLQWETAADSWLCLCHSNEHGVLVEFQLKDRRDERSWSFTTHSFQSTQVLLHNIMKTPQFLPISLFEWRRFKDHTDVSLVDEARSIVSRLQAHYGFSIVFTRSQKTFNCILSWTTPEGLLQID